MSDQPKPRRITVPFLIDVVFVSSADQIRQVNASDAVDRLHAIESKRLPWWVKFFFRATRFHDAQKDVWFLPFETTDNPSYTKRINYLKEKFAEGYTREQVQQIAKLLQDEASDEFLAHAMVQVVNQRFFGHEIPHDVCLASGDTLKSIGEALSPSKYRAGREGHQEVMAYCEKHLGPEAEAIDVGHSIGVVVQSAVGALRHLKTNPDRSVESILTGHPPSEQVPRIATRASTLDGLLDNPTTPGRTIFICKIGEAAIETGDLTFSFSDGRPDRSCVFTRFMIDFMKEVQAELHSKTTP